MRKHFLRYIRDISIALSVVSGMAMCYRAYARRRGALVRVVVFHDVSDAMWFERLIAHMRARYHVLTPTDFFANTFHPKKINILITFDDGYASWATVCAPILEAEGVLALFFVNSHLLEVSHDSELTRAFTHDNLLLATPRALLTSKQLISLIGQGHSIGGHTKNHARLAALQKDEEEAEVVEDKKVLETYTHDALRAFAYPFGHRGDFTSRSMGAVARAGYT
ncbi:MAG TPA: polysaccharide deacetylase family protein, partial [Candidatus Paceibacterota bacterium]|nr:polysaccharide deacetylase family protein [Candidatus Paceibacterota bacterium]